MTNHNHDVEQNKKFIEYWSTLELNEYLQEPEALRHKVLSETFLNSKPKPSWTKKFIDNIIKPFTQRIDNTKDQKWAKRIADKKYDLSIIRYTKHLLMVAKEIFKNNEYKYKDWYVINIYKMPKMANQAIYMLETTANPKYENGFEILEWEEMKQKIKDLLNKN